VERPVSAVTCSKATLRVPPEAKVSITRETEALVAIVGGEGKVDECKGERDDDPAADLDVIFRFIL